MKKLSLLLMLSVFVFCSCDNDDDKEQTHVLSLPDYSTHTLDLGDINNPLDSWSTTYGETTTNYYHTLLTDNTKLFEFDCVSSDNYGFGSDGFAFTNCTVDDCADFQDYDYRAVIKKGVRNNTYVIVGASGYEIGENSDKNAAIRFKDDDNPNEAEAYQVKGMYVTNCIFAYKSMKLGEGYTGLDEQFGANDSFKLKIYNMDKSMHVECYLAEGTNVLTEWKWVDLTALGKTSGLRFELESTKYNDYGNITPNYFCLDGITLLDD